MDIESVRGMLTTRRIGHPLIYLASVGSTMDVVRDMASDGGPEGLVVVADEQTAGRGRFGRTWIAPAGVNLSPSILVRPSVAVMKRLGIVAPLAVADAVRAVSGLDVSFKWPNDVRIGERKLCGVLIEGGFSGDRPTHAIVGIGLNVNLDAARYPEIADIATSIARELGRLVSREQTLAELLNAFERYYDAPDAESLRLAWRERLDTLGQDIAVTFGGRTEYGVAEDVDSDGALLLRRGDGSLTTIPAGEVTLRPPGTST